jgi:hypothetical protein
VAGVAAVEQGGDAIRIEFEQGHFLPEPVGELAIGPGELRLGELAHQVEHQLLLLQVGETP